MNTNKQLILSRSVIAAVVLALIGGHGLTNLHGYVRAARGGGAVAAGGGRAAAAGPRGAAVAGPQGAAAVGPRGAAVRGDEGYAAARRGGGAVAVGDEGYAARGRYGGAVVAGDEGYAARGYRGGVVVGDYYEDYEGWRAVAGVGVGIAVGTMLARPPATSTTVVVNGTSYYQDGQTYYLPTYSGGQVVYQVVPPPQ